MTLGEHVAIDGPSGPFFIPNDHSETRRICEGLSRSLWDGEYDHPRLPTTGVATALDIGAGWGAFAVWARKKWGPALAITCYEPHARGAAYVRANDPAATVLELAVTARSTARIRVGLDWGCTSVLPDEGDEVPILHPADLPPCDLLKCDAEGIEPELLEHYRHWGSLRVLAYEWHGAEHRVRCRELCEKLSGGMKHLGDRESPWGSGTAIWLRTQE